MMGQREAAAARTAAAARDFQGSGSGRGSDVMKNGGSGSGRGSDIMKKGGSGSGRGSDVIIAARRAAIIIAAQVLISTFCSILSPFSSLISIPVSLLLASGFGRWPLCEKFLEFVSADLILPIRSRLNELPLFSILLISITLSFFLIFFIYSFQ